MSAWGRRRARRALIQAVYQWQLTADAPADIRAQFVNNGALKKADGAFFDACLNGVVADVEALDGALSPHLDRDVAALDQVERAILRAGAFELRSRLDVPRAVVIDEHIRLAKQFGAEGSYKYVNGVLDAVARAVRNEATAPGPAPAAEAPGA